MSSRCGRWVIAFNGEIYNHLHLRERLASGMAQASPVQDAGPGWRGHSDTETLLACVARWGVAKTLDMAEGMFAIALWDRQERCLHLARDRMGEKPLYYGWVGKGLAFASELKALRALPGFDASLDRSAIAAFLKTNAVPAPLSIYAGIGKLEPGNWLAITLGDVESRRLRAAQPYWRLLDVARSGRTRPLSFESDEAAVDALHSVLSDAVRAQMLSDVPLGAFLSGGVDSSTVVALMQSHAERPVKTFSIGFREDGYDEAKHAKAVARHLRTDHTELYIDDQAARDVIPLLPGIYCEPFADSSQIPTYLVSKLARERVKVCLSGDGGDELFAGYRNYLLAARAWAGASALPLRLRLMLASALRSVAPRTWNAGFRAIGPLVPQRVRASLSGDKVLKGAELLAARSFTEFYRDGFSAHWRPEVLLEAAVPSRPAVAEDPLDDFATIERMMIGDALTFLPDDILVKVDRAAMGVSLETRVPLLDRRVVEFAWHLPLHYKVRHGQGKWVLRQLLYRMVPRELVERPKMGFGVPIDRWLRGPLRDWAESLLDESRLRREGYFDPALIARRWREHQSGERNWHYQLWRVLMFQAWLDHPS